MQEDKILIQELIVQLPHESGSLSHMCESLDSVDANLLGFGLEIQGDLGYIRIVVDKLDLTKQIFERNNIRFFQNGLLAIGIPHIPGAFLTLAKIYEEAGENIQYCYPLIKMINEEAIVCFQSDNPSRVYLNMVEKGISIFTKEKINQTGI